MYKSSSATMVRTDCFGKFFDEMLAWAVLLLLVAGIGAQIACNNIGPRTDCGYVGITQQQCAAKSKINRTPASCSLMTCRLLLEPHQSRSVVLLCQWAAVSSLSGAAPHFVSDVVLDHRCCANGKRSHCELVSLRAGAKSVWCRYQPTEGPHATLRTFLDFLSLRWMCTWKLVRSLIALLASSS